MTLEKPNGNRNNFLRLLFIFRVVSIVIVLFAGIYLVTLPEGKMNNKNLLAGIFIAYSILRGYRLLVEYRRGNFRQDPNKNPNDNE